MKHLDKLLAEAFPEEVKSVPPAPVDKAAIRDKTFQKLGLDRPKASPFQAWADPVVKKSHPWSWLAACLVLVVGACALGIPLFTSFGAGGTENVSLGTAGAQMAGGDSTPVEGASERSTTLASAPGTFFEARAVSGLFDPETNTLTLTLEARTDMDLDSENAGELYAWFYSLYLNVPGAGDMDIGQYDGATLDALAQWTQTGEDTYQSAPITIPIPPELLEEHGLTGWVDGVLYLTVTDLTQGEESPIQFFPEISFTVDLTGEEGFEVYTDYAQ